jgi:probable F420-dependent oxidoreductase
MSLEFVVATAFCDPVRLPELARAAEACGYRAVSVSDHVVHPETIRSPYPYTADGRPRFGADAPWPDPWVAIGAMAAVTSELRFLTNVYVLPLRNPFLVAKAVGSAAVLSGDRVGLGIGVGWMRDEFELLEQRFADRGARTDEMIEILRKLWTGQPVEHAGRFYRFPPLHMAPAPGRPVPIYVGGTSEAALRRAARLGDGWISELHTTSEIAEFVARLRRERAAAGRSGPFAVFASATDAADPDGFRRLEDAGVTHALTQPWLFYGVRRGPFEEQRRGLERFADEVVAKLR